MSKHSLRYDREILEQKVHHLLDTLDLIPEDLSLYVLAFIHRSVLNESSIGYTESNERLEFLGDAVLELVITEHLFHDFPLKPEGELTDIRSALVRGRNLAEIASHLGYAHAIQLSRGEHLAAGHENPYILANTFEAVIGAISLDLGLERARSFILAHVYPTLDHIMKKWLYVDPKSYLQEITQGVWGRTPLYQVMHEEGEDHSKTYHVQVFVDTTVIGSGKGTSKKKAEQDAAEDALGHREEWYEKIMITKKAGHEQYALQK